MHILYSRYAPALLERLYEMAGSALDEHRQMLVLVPAQASFMIENGILQHCGRRGFMDLEVLSFEKLTERIGSLAGGRAVQALDASGFSMLAKLAMSRCAEQLQALDSRDPALHMRAAELIASLKNEQISPEQLHDLAGQCAGPMAAKLADLACIYETMESLAGNTLQDSRDLERTAAQHFAQTPFITEKEIVIFGFDVLPRLRMQTICALAASARDVTVLAEAEQDGVLEKQWDNLRRLQQLAEMSGLQVKLQPVGGSVAGEIGHLFEHIYQYPYHPYEEEPHSLTLTEAYSREQEVRQAAAEILQYTCVHGFRMSEIGVIVGDTAQYADWIEEIFTKAGIPFYLQNKRSLAQSSLWACLQPLLALLCRENWRLQDALAYAKSSMVGERPQVDQLVRYCRERGVKGYQLKKGLGSQAPEELELLRERIFAPVCRLQEQIGKENLSELLLAHCRALQMEEKLKQQSARAEETGLLAQSRFVQQVYPAMEELIAHAAMLGQLPIQEYTDALTAGVQSRELSIIPPTTDEVVVGDAIHAIWTGKRALFVLGVNEGMLPAIPDESGLITGSEAQQLRTLQPAFPNKMAFEDQKAYLRKNLTLGQTLHLFYNRQDGQPSYLIDRVRTLFPRLQTRLVEQARIPHADAALEQLARELRACADRGVAPDWATAAYFEGDPQALGSMLAEVYAKPELTAMPPQTARALYGAPRASVSRIEEYYRCPYRHFVTYGLRPRETEDYGETAMEAGTYVHALMEEFTREAQLQGESWEGMEEARIERIMERVAERLKGSHNYGIFTEKRYAFMEKRLREEACLAVKAVRAQFSGTRAHIAGEEMGFGGDILRLPTRFGLLTVRGKIDRVDEAQGENGTYLRVVDYKTGAKKFSLSDVCYGVGLQLIIYLMAAESRCRSLGHPAEPAGGFYFSIQLPYLEEGEEEGKRLEKFRMNGFLLASYDAARALDNGDKKLNSMNAELETAEQQVKLGDNCFTREELQRIFAYAGQMVVQAAEQIYGGKLEVRPLEQSGRLPCEFCDYASVCMFDGAQEQVQWEKQLDKEAAMELMERRLQEGE